MDKTYLKITASISGIKYKPLLCRELKLVDYNQLQRGIAKNASFLLRTITPANIAISWWVSPKRTRSYPYARVYDTLGFAGKKATIIPIIKDEGKDGDRDFLQWDTISLMSLLGVYVILGYYTKASKNINFTNKITNQQFSFSEIEAAIEELLSYQSDALHWNLSKIDKVGEIANKAFKTYRIISDKLNIEMHSETSARKRIKELLKGKNEFMNLSRGLAEKAQKRESITKQPKENLLGAKATITIKNYLGGYYFFTADEAWIEDNKLYLAEGKHSKQNDLPSGEDIKDGLLKMIIFTSLENVKVEEKIYNTIPILKLTTVPKFNENQLSSSKVKLMDILRHEAEVNHFRISLNNKFIV